MVISEDGLDGILADDPVAADIVEVTLVDDVVGFFGNNTSLIFCYSEDVSTWYEKV